MSSPRSTSPATFFGEPLGLGYLAFTEAWERFSFYGMIALLVLYMSKALFLPGHVEHVAGFATFRAGLEHLFGPMSTLALASQVLGLYTGFVYFTPVFGGIVADRWLGRRNAVVIGAVLMSAGHIAMAFDASFLLALLLLVAGCSRATSPRRSARCMTKTTPPGARGASRSSPSRSMSARWWGRCSAVTWRRRVACWRWCWQGHWGGCWRKTTSPSVGRSIIFERSEKISGGGRWCRLRSVLLHRPPPEKSLRDFIDLPTKGEVI